MARPRASVHQQMRAYCLYANGLGPTAMRKELEEKFENPVSPRTVSAWIRDFRGLAHTVVALDVSFEWQLLGGYGLPWEAGRYLLELWAYASEEPLISYMRIQWPASTVRQAKWWWRVHKAAPTLEHYDVLLLAHELAWREMAYDVLDLPFEACDLQALLAYRPWEGGGGRERYLRALQKGRIQAFKYTLGQGIDVQEAARKSGVADLVEAIEKVPTAVLISKLATLRAQSYLDPETKVLSAYIHFGNWDEGFAQFLGPRGYGEPTYTK